MKSILASLLAVCACLQNAHAGPSLRASAMPGGSLRAPLRLSVLRLSPSPSASLPHLALPQARFLSAINTRAATPFAVPNAAAPQAAAALLSAPRAQAQTPAFKALPSSKQGAALAAAARGGEWVRVRGWLDRSFDGVLRREGDESSRGESAAPRDSPSETSHVPGQIIAILRADALAGVPGQSLEERAREFLSQAGFTVLDVFPGGLPGNMKVYALLRTEIGGEKAAMDKLIGLNKDGPDLVLGVLRRTAASRPPDSGPTPARPTPMPQPWLQKLDPALRELAMGLGPKETAPVTILVNLPANTEAISQKEQQRIFGEIAKPILDYLKAERVKTKQVLWLIGTISAELSKKQILDLAKLGAVLKMELERKVDAQPEGGLALLRLGEGDSPEAFRPPDWSEDRRINAALQALSRSPIGLDLYRAVYAKYGSSLRIEVDDTLKDYGAIVAWHDGAPVLWITAKLLESPAEAVASFIAREFSDLYYGDFPVSAERAYLAYGSQVRVFAELTGSGLRSNGYWWDRSRDQYVDGRYAVESYYGSWKEAAQNSQHTRVQDSAFFRWLQASDDSNTEPAARLSLREQYERGIIGYDTYRKMSYYFEQIVRSERSWLANTGRW